MKIHLFKFDLQEMLLYKNIDIVYFLAIIQTKIWKNKRQERFQTNWHRTIQSNERQWESVVRCKFASILFDVLCWWLSFALREMARSMLSLLLINVNF